MLPLRLRKAEEGGHPQFNHDGKPDTPAFLPRFHYYSEADHLTFRSSLERIEARANIASCKENANLRNNTPNINSRNSAEDNPECRRVVEEFMAILASKNRKNSETAESPQL